jgi:hypothetical protein
MRRAVKVLSVWSVLCLAPLAGVSCGDPSLSPGAEGPLQSTSSNTPSQVDEFDAMKPVVILDRGQWCATVRIGGVVAFLDCFHSDRLPLHVYTDFVRRFILIAVSSGDTVAFLGGNVRVVATSEHWVAGQMSTTTSLGEIRFTVTSDEGIRLCALTNQLVTSCEN